MEKILVLTQSYPSKESIYNMAYVHSRNIEYVKHGIHVDVLSFSNSQEYFYEGIRVFSPRGRLNFKEYDVILSHAPNIRNHFRKIVANFFNINELIFFFHGHEALILEDYYPSPYSWQKQPSFVLRKLRRFYDFAKLKMLKVLLKSNKVRAIFVSEWMKKEASKCFDLSFNDEKKYTIINNSNNFSFVENKYQFSPKESLADFITIRPLDGKKYAVDKVVEIAKKNPGFKFHIYGKGDYFKFNDQPKNVEVFNNFIEQKDIPRLLNRYRGALMPTRLDAQGVMMCEMASFGLPIIVSDLPVCREMLNSFENCVFINNNDFESTDLSSFQFKSLVNFEVTEKFSSQKLSKRELDFIFNKGV